MRLLLLTQYVHPEPFPVNSLFGPLRQRGVDITVLTGQPNYPDGVVYDGYRAGAITQERIDGGIEVFRVPTVPRGTGSATRLLANYLWFVAAASTIGAWLLRGRRFDVVFVYAPSPITQTLAGAVLARLKGAKLVTWVQDLWPQSLEATGFVRNRTLLKVAEVIIRWTYRRHDLLLGQSEAFVEAIRPMASGVQVAYLPNPGDPLDEEPPAPGDPTFLLAPGFNIVFAGNLGTVQSLETIVDAAERVHDDPSIRFVLIGSGSRAAWLAEEVRRRRLANVQLPGRFPRSAMAAIFRQADAVLVTLARSPILAQTIPSKVQSYLASGRPVLGALDGEGARLIRTTGAGLASPAEDGMALAENVRRLKGMSVEDRTAMGRDGRRAFQEHFHPDAVAGRVIGMLNTLIGFDEVQIRTSKPV